MRRFLAVSFPLILGIALAAVGIPLALWVATALYRAEVALNWAVWALELSPLPLYAPAARVANDMIQRDALVAAGLAAAVLCLMAFSSLRSARQALRSADESHDGRATIELKTQPLRVGRPVEGSIWLAQGPQRGAVYRVELSCQRGDGSGKSERTQTAYCEELEVAPVLTPVGWSLPFRFIVPPIAPASGAGSFMSGPGYRWRLAVQRSKGWISFPSVFALDLAPAPPEVLRAFERRESARTEPELKRTTDEVQQNAGRQRVPHEGAELREPYSDPETARQRAFGDVTPGDARAHDTVAHNRSTGVSETASLFGKIVKWLLLILFGGALAISAVALATAVLLSLL